MRTWQDNADEFAALTRQGRDLRLAVLVACSVEYRSTGRPRNDRDRTKTTAREFGLRAGCGHHRIVRHLEAWDQMAAEGLVDSSRVLVPDHVNGIVITAAIEQRWRRIVFAVVHEAAKEVMNSTSSRRVLRDVELPIEHARLVLAPVARQLDHVRRAAAQLDDDDRAALAVDLRAVAASMHELIMQLEGHAQNALIARSDAI